MLLRIPIVLLLLGLSASRARPATRLEVESHLSKINDVKETTAPVNSSRSNDLRARENDLHSDLNEEQNGDVAARSKRRVHIHTSSSHTQRTTRLARSSSRNQKTKRHLIQPHRSTLENNLLSLLNGFQKILTRKVNNIMGSIFNVLTPEKQRDEVTARPTTTTEAVHTTAKVIDVADNKDKDVTHESLSKLLQSDVFWKWLSSWTNEYGKVLTQEVKYLVKDEVKQEVDKKCKDKEIYKDKDNEIPIIKDKEEIGIQNDSDKNSKNPSTNKKDKNDIKEGKNGVKADSIYSNAVGSDHITNIFVFYPNDPNKTFFNKTNNDLDSNNTFPIDNKIEQNPYTEKPSTKAIIENNDNEKTTTTQASINVKTTESVKDQAVVDNTATTPSSIDTTTESILQNNTTEVPHTTDVTNADVALDKFNEIDDSTATTIASDTDIDELTIEPDAVTQLVTDAINLTEESNAATENTSDATTTTIDVSTELVSDLTTVSIAESSEASAESTTV